jgi:hypothetical protein
LVGGANYSYEFLDFGAVSPAGETTPILSPAAGETRTYSTAILDLQYCYFGETSAIFPVEKLATDRPTGVRP